VQCFSEPGVASDAQRAALAEERVRELEKEKTVREKENTALQKENTALLAQLGASMWDQLSALRRERDTLHAAHGLTRTRRGGGGSPGGRSDFAGRRGCSGSADAGGGGGGGSGCAGSG